VIVLAISANAYALDPARKLSQYVHRIWQVQQGLPQASIYAVVQSHDGYLWLGTETGLVKFDGIRFTTIDDAVSRSWSNAWVTQLAEDSHGAMWIGTRHAGVIALRDGKATRYSERAGLPSDETQCLVAGEDGVIWVCTPQGLAELSGEKVRTFGTSDGLTSVNIRAACTFGQGTLIVGTGDGRVAMKTRAGFTPRSMRQAVSAPVQAMLCARDGTLWIGTDEGLLRIRGEQEDRLTRSRGLADDSILALTESRDGSVFVGTKSGFSRIRGNDIESFRPQDGLSQSTVYAAYEDREGSLWVATKHGLNQFLDGRAIPYTTNEGLPSNSTGPVMQDTRGTIWVGTLDAGLARFDGRHFDVLTRRDGLSSNSIYALAEDAGGDLWVGTGAGLDRVRRGRVIATFTTRQGLPDDRVRALYIDHTGTLWAATAGGVAALHNGVLHASGAATASSTEPVSALAEDRGHQLHAVPQSGSPMFAHADALYEDGSGLLWVGTLGEGLRLVEGDNVWSFSVVDGLFDDVIYGIAADDRGRLWFACSKGIFSVSRADLLQFAAGTLHAFVSTPYSPLDGLRTIECRSGVQPVVSRMRDGRLWFSTIRGLLVVDPDRSERRFTPPAVAIEDVTIDGERNAPAGIGELPPGRHNVEFSYTGMSFIAPARITFRYMLDGFDKIWVDAGPRRQAFYTNLPPGRFRFRVAACNPEGECGAPNVAAITIHSRYYQRGWFFPALACALALLGWCIYRLRVRRMKEHFAVILAERGRIARELHDTLIQGFAGVTMAMQALASRLPASDERRALEDIVGDAGASLRDARRSLAGLRQHAPHSGLTAAVAQTARQFIDAGSVRLKLELGECQRELAPDVEYNLVRIAQEAILNAVKHSGARTVHVTLGATVQRLMLSVRDDGRGFDEAGDAPIGHYGVIGMKERASQIGAHFQLTSVPGQGTTVSVVMEG
jgi:ligand-binding sensor domain-containing protein